MKDYNASFVEGPNGPTAGCGKDLRRFKDAYSMASRNATTGDELRSQRLSFVNTTGIDIGPAILLDGNMVYTSSVQARATSSTPPADVSGTSTASTRRPALSSGTSARSTRPTSGATRG